MILSVCVSSLDVSLYRSCELYGLIAISLTRSLTSQACWCLSQNLKPKSESGGE